MREKAEIETALWGGRCCDLCGTCLLRLRMAKERSGRSWSSRPPATGTARTGPGVRGLIHGNSVFRIPADRPIQFLRYPLS
eukprot:3679831-Prymnesium_polylepis.1